MGTDRRDLGCVFSRAPATYAPDVPMLRGLERLQWADAHLRQCLLTASRRRVNELNRQFGEVLAKTKRSLHLRLQIPCRSG